MPADAALHLPEPGAATARAMPTGVTGWGGGEPAPVRLLCPAGVEDLRSAVADVRRGVPSGRGGAIARGMGRSYGDAAQLRNGVVIDTTGLRHFELDGPSGTVTAGAGVTIGELLGRLVPAGWMVPVVPGTQHVSVGGAIASDIHGKNHAAEGTFGAHVEALGLLTSTGELRELTPDDDPDGAFAATVGGMGLTGVIVWARVRLRPVGGALLTVDADRVEDLDAALSVLAAPGGPYRVAWLDLLCSRPGRGVVTRADHLPAGADGRRRASSGARADGATVSARATVPAWWPGGVLRPAAVRAFNELRFRRAPQCVRGRVETLGEHLFPLDSLDAWPRLYGRRGFVQYQLAVPGGTEHVLHDVIEELRRSGVPCYLAVLKDFGPAGSPPLSFPLAGWTMTLDLPRAATGLDALLERFDELVAASGGRVYLSKDARLRADALAAMYPRLEEWRLARDRIDPDRVWRSDLGLRTGLVTP